MHYLDANATEPLRPAALAAITAALAVTGNPSSVHQAGRAVRRILEDARDAIAAGNRQYEARFGHVFLISAEGRTPAEILTELRRRLGNNPEDELRVAADEHRRITRLRLERMVG